MRTYQFFIDDDRYDVPTLQFVTVRDDQRAREWVDRVMKDSAHHHGVQVVVGGHTLFAVGSYAKPQTSADAHA